MYNTLKILQLNTRKQDMVQQSLLNDTGVKDFGALAITEPYAWKSDKGLVITPLSHTKWDKIIPPIQHDGYWAIRSMIWIKKELNSVQIRIESTDITAVIIRLKERDIFLASVYVPGGDTEALRQTIILLNLAITQAQQLQQNRPMDFLITGDFNRHDQLWGGNSVITRQGEAEPIIEFMNEHQLQSMLPRGTKTWQKENQESTIDLTLGSESLYTTMIKCDIYDTEHGSDHRAIETILDIEMPEFQQQNRYIFKNAPWKQINNQINLLLQNTAEYGSIQEQTDRLMAVVTNTVFSLTPKAKPTPYSKRWWTADLTELRRIYTHCRNKVRALRRAQIFVPELEKDAKNAAKIYHQAIRTRKKTHWNEFLADKENIWQAAKYLNPQGSAAFDKIPPLIDINGVITETAQNQADTLLNTFFPPLPENIEPEIETQSRQEAYMDILRLEEIERALFKAKPWKGPGEDQLPIGVWQNIWPTVKTRVLQLFQDSFAQGILPYQWKTAKIIPFKKPGKGDYTIPGSWRPISLLSTLGKLLESVIAERLSFLVEEFGMLPATHFGARKRRSTEQALILLQEAIYKAWRSKKVLSLISFDVKGAYNGVYKERLLQRLIARKTPLIMVKWIDAFCSNRTASILINGYTSKSQELTQAGLPQGSPLSPILYLFFNADLIQSVVNTNKGSIAFVDDYSAWVTGTSATENHRKIKEIVKNAENWEKRSGATFDPKKTSYIHFTRVPERNSERSLYIKGNKVDPKSEVKLLGVIMDARLKFKTHTAKAATKGTKAAMALNRLKNLAPSTARQLYNATVVPVMEYGSNVWGGNLTKNDIKAFDRAQKIGAQAITGCFKNTAAVIAEAEASLMPIDKRIALKATNFYINIKTLPQSNPLTRLQIKPFKRFPSPLQRMAVNSEIPSTINMETIKPYTIAPWKQRIYIETNTKKAFKESEVLIATSTSVKNQVFGIGTAVLFTGVNPSIKTAITSGKTINAKNESNGYISELIAILTALRGLKAAKIQNQNISIISSNRGALLSIKNPKIQSGQQQIQDIYNITQMLNISGNTIEGVWISKKDEYQLQKLAKEAAKKATQIEWIPQEGRIQAKAPLLTDAKRKYQKNTVIPNQVGVYSTNMDAALPGKHTKKMYDLLTKSEARILAQLRTGMAKLNGFLFRIKATDSEICECGNAKETVKHFLFTCNRWTHLRRDMHNQTVERWADLSFFLGGRSPQVRNTGPLDPLPWNPNISAIKATIRFAANTKRLDFEQNIII